MFNIQPEPPSCTHAGWPIGVAFALLITGCQSGPPRTDGAIRDTIVHQSVAAYSGACPCPYSAAHNGTVCGRHSAYEHSKPHAPECYTRDVTAAQLASYRAEHWPGVRQ